MGGAGREGRAVVKTELGLSRRLFKLGLETVFLLPIVVYAFFLLREHRAFAYYKLIGFTRVEISFH